MGSKLIFSRTDFDKEANNGQGEWKAYFAKDEGLAKAFGSAASKASLTTRGGIVSYNMEKLNERIGELSAVAGSEDTLAELQKGRARLQLRIQPPVQVAALRA
jgi:hypothetical protein